MSTEDKTTAPDQQTAVGGRGLSEGLGRVMAWQAKCGACKNLLRSGAANTVWHCAAVRRGASPVYAVTARGNSKTGRCGPAGALFEAA